jgi:chromosome segregation ATPase
MNASSNSMSNNSGDGEVTAELPVLDVAAYEARHGHDPLASTDTWQSPTLSSATTTLNTAILPNLAHVAPDHVSETMPSKNLSATLASKIEGELRSLASNLEELETRLAAKGERLAIIEAELAESRDAGKAAAERAAALSDELTGSRAAVAAATTQIEGLQQSIREREDAIRAAGERANGLQHSLQRLETDIAENAVAANTRTATLVATHEGVLKAAWQQVAQLQTQSAAQHEALQAMEGRRGIFDSMLRGLDLQLAGRDQDHAKLGEELARHTTRLAELTRDLESRSQRVAQLEAEVAALNTNLGARSDEVGAVARANNELNQALEAQRQDSAARAVRVTELEAQIVAGNQIHAEALRAAAAAHSELQAANTALSAHKSALTAELDDLREESAEHVAAVQQMATQHSDRMAQIDAQNQKIETLTAQVSTQAQTILADAERIRVTQERINIAENDLRASEEAINHLESELRSRNMRIEELTRINTQMQGDIADARRWLGERDGLMQRLETEAAHSAALVDNIQRSMRALTPANSAAVGTPDAPGATSAPAAAMTGAALRAQSAAASTSGNYEGIREQGARLLVRKLDGHEVVHVLGRKTTIGRTPDNDLQVDASFVSRHHAVLLLTGNQTVIEDLNSTNGVYVNGTRITRETLSDGDVVMVGKARFRFAVRAAVARPTVELSTT